MRRLAGLSAGWLLAACGGAEQRLALPLTAPEGVHRLAKDFVEIRSIGLGKPDAAINLAARGERLTQININRSQRLSTPKTPNT